VYDLPGANIRDLVELTRRFHVTPEQLLDGLPITMAALGEPGRRVPLRVCEAIVSRAYELTKEPALAFWLGTSMRLSSHGFLGFAAMTASTAREALELAVKFAGTRTSAVGLAYYIEGETASIVIEERTPLGALREFVVLALMVGLGQISQVLTGQVIAGVGECAFPQPAYIKAMPLDDWLRFDQPVHRLVFASRVLDLPLVSADVVATQLAREQCERELATLAEAGLPGRIRACLAARTGAGLDEVARDLRVSPRTLKRKLAERGTTFSAIRDEVRLQRALLLLDDRGLTVTEVADRLGYTEVPNFTRAFRKWTGMTPVAYRERNRGAERVST
jgi:AraC-like DNA-binding protein